MALKNLIVTIDAAGRDQGKVFFIREMPAARSEKWAIKAFLALAHSGVELSEEITQAGLAGIAVMGLQALRGLRFEDAEPLMDEMFTCVSRIPSSTKPEIIRNLVDDDIEEVATRLRLRKEIFALHVDFFTDAEPSK